MAAITREEILQRLKAHRDRLTQMGVCSIALFGSAARGELGPESDIDLLVEFEKAPGFDGYMAVKLYLESLLGRKVDLVMKGALRPWAREVVEKQAIDVP